jgi:hypothetical protein
VTPVSQILVRLLPGKVGESRRVVHVVPIPDVEEIPDVLTAYCGEEIRPDTAEWLPQMCGMPCTTCAFTAPAPQTGELPTTP